MPLFSRRFLSLAAGLLCLLALPAFAQTAVADAPGVSSGAIVRMLIGLGFILALLFGGAWFLRRLNGGRSFGHSGPMRVVGGLMLSARERIVLIEVADEWIVVGVVPGQIKTLHTMPKGELPEGVPGEKPFVQWLKQMSDRGNEKN